MAGFKLPGPLGLEPPDGGHSAHVGPEDEYRCPTGLYCPPETRYGGTTNPASSLAPSFRGATSSTKSITVPTCRTRDTVSVADVTGHELCGYVLPPHHQIFLDGDVHLLDGEVGATIHVELRRQMPGRCSSDTMVLSTRHPVSMRGNGTHANHIRVTFRSLYPHGPPLPPGSYCVMILLYPHRSQHFRSLNGVLRVEPTHSRHPHSRHSHP